MISTMRSTSARVMHSGGDSMMMCVPVSASLCPEQGVQRFHFLPVHGEFFFRSTVFHQLDGSQESETADVSHCWMRAQPLELFQQIRPHGCGVLHQAFALENIEVGERTGDRLTAEGQEVRQPFPGVTREGFHDFGRQMAAAIGA